MNSPREELELRLTAMLLGELSAEETDALQQVISHDPELQRLHDEMKQTISLVHEAVALPESESINLAEPLQLSANRREQLFQSFKVIRPKELKPAKRSPVSHWVQLAAMIVILLTFTALFLPATRLAKSKSKRVSESYAVHASEGIRYSEDFERETPEELAISSPEANQVVLSEPEPADRFRLPLRTLKLAPVTRETIRERDEKQGGGPASPGNKFNAPATPAGDRTLEVVVDDSRSKSTMLGIALPDASGSSIWDREDNGRQSSRTDYFADSVSESARGFLESAPAGPSSAASGVGGGIGGFQPTQPVRPELNQQGLDLNFQARGESLAWFDNGIQTGQKKNATTWGTSTVKELGDLANKAGETELLAIDGTRLANDAYRFETLPGSAPMNRRYSLQPTEGFKSLWDVDASGVKGKTEAGKNPTEIAAVIIPAIKSNSDFGQVIEEDQLGSNLAKDVKEVAKNVQANGGDADFIGALAVNGSSKAQGPQSQREKIDVWEKQGVKPSSEAPLTNRFIGRFVETALPREESLHGGLKPGQAGLAQGTVWRSTMSPEMRTRYGLDTPTTAATPGPRTGKEIQAAPEAVSVDRLLITELKEPPAVKVPIDAIGLEKGISSGVEEPDVNRARPAAAAPIPQPEIQTAVNAYSTFSLNVSDVSFKLAAGSLEKGVMPDASTVRSEEFINAFDYRDPEPGGSAPLAFAWERARYPFAHNRDLLRFSVKTAASGRQPGRPLNLVLLLDNSGSMERADRVRIVRECLRVLGTQLQPQDRISVVAFARTPRLWIDGLPGNQAGELVKRVGGLVPEGGTNLEEGMKVAYETALKHFLAQGVNRVVLLTDGAANLGDVQPESLKKKVEAHRQQGIALDCFGIGWEGFNDELLETLSRNGDGRYGFVNTPESASSEFASHLAGALKVAASDVKVQVEFNPKRVSSYRQIGYAKHQLKKEQFRDNTVDAAEIGAAEAGNALYAVQVNPAGEGPLATVRVRFKIPGTGEYREHAWPVPYEGNARPLEKVGATLRLASVASAFSEWLVTSPYAGEVTPDRLLSYLGGVPESFPSDPRPKKLEWMIRQAKSISGK